MTFTDTGCSYHDNCFTCPFPDCKASDVEAAKSAKPKKESVKPKHKKDSVTSTPKPPKTPKPKKGRKQTQREYYQKNKERICAYSRKYHADNKERLNKVSREYARSHSDQHQLIGRRYYRLKQLEAGTVEPVGYINVEGRPVSVYKGTKGMFWYVDNDTYREVSDFDLSTRMYSKFKTTKLLKLCTIAKLQNYREECTNLDDRMYFDIAIDCINKIIDIESE